MRDADDGLDVAEAALEHLVAPDLGHVAEPKKRVVGEDGADAHGAGVHDGLHAERAQRGVRVDDVDRLAHKDRAEVREGGEEVGQGRVDVGRRKRLDGDVVDLDAVGEPAHAVARWVRVRDDDDLCEEAHRQLSRLALVAESARERRERTRWLRLARD